MFGKPRREREFWETDWLNLVLFNSAAKRKPIIIPTDIISIFSLQIKTLFRTVTRLERTFLSVPTKTAERAQVLNSTEEQQVVLGSFTGSTARTEDIKDVVFFMSFRWRLCVIQYTVHGCFILTRIFENTKWVDKARNLSDEKVLCDL